MWSFKGLEMMPIKQVVMHNVYATHKASGKLYIITLAKVMKDHISKNT